MKALALRLIRQARGQTYAFRDRSQGHVRYHYDDEEDFDQEDWSEDDSSEAIGSGPDEAKRRRKEGDKRRISASERHRQRMLARRDAWMAGNRPCAQQYVGKSQSCMDGRRGGAAVLRIHCSRGGRQDDCAGAPIAG